MLDMLVTEESITIKWCKSIIQTLLEEIEWTLLTFMCEPIFIKVLLYISNKEWIHLH